MQVFTTLQQIMAMLVAMQKEDNTLEFKNSLTAERLFLNKYPDLKSDFQPIAMGVIHTGNNGEGEDDDDECALQRMIFSE